VAPPAYGWQPFGLRLPAGWQRATGELDPDSSMAAISGPDNKSCTISVFKIGAFDPATIGGSKRAVTVTGHQGWSGTIPAERGTWRVTRFSGLFWEFYPNAWAMVGCSGNISPAPGSALDRLNHQMAAAVLPDEQPLLRSPVSFGYLPDGFVVTRVAFGLIDDGPDGIAQVTLKKGTRFIVVWLESPGSGITDGGEHLVVDGRPARFEGRAYLRVWYPGYDLQLSAEEAGLADPRAEVLKIKAGMKLAPPQDRTNWTTAAIGL
jgi:hypothetical protein